MAENHKKIEQLKMNGTFNKDAAKVNANIFKENMFFDSNDLLQVKYEMLRSVEKEGETVSSAAQKFGFSRVSYYKIKEDFDLKGVMGLIPKKRGPHHARKLEQTSIKFVDGLIKENPKVTKMKILEKLHIEKGIKVSKRTLERALANKKKLKKS